MARFDLFLVSGLILFLELACIRWLPAHVLFLSFFTNTVLLAGFVGMSVGCLTARKPGRAVAGTPYWLLALVAAGALVGAFRGKLERHTAVGDQNRPEVVFFGAEVNALKPVEFTVPVELVAGAFFLLTAAAFVGPGRELGRAFTRVPNRTTAYALDLLGSLAGIALFAACSYLQLPPVVWFAAAAAGIGYFALKPVSGDATGVPAHGRWPCRSALIPLALAVALTVPTSGLWPRGAEGTRTAWSPYYRIDYEPGKRFINTNLISHQVMHPRGNPTHAQYDLPYLFRQAAGGPMFKRVLVIGSGSGNDLARCLYWRPDDAVIDAVEIDPVIQRIGAADHPDRPYRDPRITVHLNDGRNFLRRAPAGEYDLVIFALVDSLVLHSGYSNLRLESYLFTQEAFRDVARVLKPDGQAAVYNFLRQGWIVARIRDELQSAFGGAEPVVLTDPPLPGDVVPLDADAAQITGFTAVFAGREAGIGPLRAAFAANGNTYWVPGRVGVTRDVTGGFGPTPPAEPPVPSPGSLVGREASALLPANRPEWVPLRPATVEPSPGLASATDDWPFLYVRRPSIPGLTWRGVALTVVLSALLWLMVRDRSRSASGGVGEWGSKEIEALRSGSPTPRLPHSPTSSDRGLLVRAFLLGAGFMLIETKAVVQMALLFGSTWTVNTVVFAAVLMMALAGNLFAGWAKPRNLAPYYAGLFLALGANLLVPPDTFLGWDYGTQAVAAAGLAFAPILFAGVVFPVSFARSPYPDRFFGANVAGALAGGLMENLSLLLGFQLLLVVAFGLYGLSGLFGTRSFGTPRAEREV